MDNREKTHFYCCNAQPSAESFLLLCSNSKFWDRQTLASAAEHIATDQDLHGLSLIQQYKRCIKM